jgi:hypothetical protein
LSRIRTQFLQIEKTDVPEVFTVGMSVFPFLAVFFLVFILRFFYICITKIILKLIIMLQPNTPAPSFSLPDQDGNIRSLEEFRGKKVVLYFYPKDNTSGCTKQACAFSELFPHFREKGAEIIGISKDSVNAYADNVTMAQPAAQLIKQRLIDKTMYANEVKAEIKKLL